MVAINAALAVDLTGQVAADTVRGPVIQRARPLQTFLGKERHA